MKQPPRAMGDTFLSLNELGISIIQGVVITLGVLFAYQFAVHNGGDEEKTRAMVFSTLIFANILLSFVNRSFFYSVLESFRNRNPLLIGISALVLMMLLVILYVKPVSLFFKVTALNISELGMTVFIAAVSVLWFEIYKYVKRIGKAKS